MTSFDDDLPPESADNGDRDDLLILAEHMRVERPVIRAAARGDIRRRLATSPARRPRHFVRSLLGFAGAGLTALAIAALGLGDLGPLKPESSHGFSDVRATTVSGVAPPLRVR